MVYDIWKQLENNREIFDLNLLLLSLNFEILLFPLN